MHKILFSAILLLSSYANAGESPTATQTPKALFNQTVADYIQAIQERDLDGIIETMTTDEDLVLIFPGGTTLYTRQEYVDFHRKWFTDMDWKMELETVYTQVHENFGIVLLKTTYTDDAGPRQGLLSLTFALEDGQWRLVFDQNTRISKE